VPEKRVFFGEKKKNKRGACDLEERNNREGGKKEKRSTQPQFG